MYENGQQPSSQTFERGLTPTFFGRVMTYFALAILTSVAGIYLSMEYLMQFMSVGMLYGLYAVELILVFTSRRWSQKYPLNRILFVAFALLTGITIAPLISYTLLIPGGTTLLTKALLATVFTFTATALIGRTTRVDLSGMRGFLTMGLVGLIAVSILGIFFPWGNTMELVVSGFGILLFSGFTMYDMQKLKHYPEDRYIDAAINLYLDIFNLFIMILRFMLAFGGRD